MSDSVYYSYPEIGTIDGKLVIHINLEHANIDGPCIDLDRFLQQEVDDLPVEDLNCLRALLQVAISQINRRLE